MPAPAQADLDRLQTEFDAVKTTTAAAATGIATISGLQSQLDVATAAQQQLDADATAADTTFWDDVKASFGNLP